MVVFKILNKISGQSYVGSCRGDIYERWTMYLDAAKAGLEFPLYSEIRQHGEAQFGISELDYADDIVELKEMELLHTVELAARSLRSYKFGLSESVIKSRRMVNRETAWTKELPADEQPVTKKVAKPSKKPTAPAVNNAVAQLTTRQPVTKTASTPSQKAIDRPTSNKTTRTPRSNPAIADASAELDKSLFAESIGLLVRTLDNVQQLSASQQQAHEQTQSLCQALERSDQALQQLQQQQNDALDKARLAMAALQASQQANNALIEAQQRARACSDSARKALDQNQETARQTTQLQQELTGLLGRMKAGASAPIAPTASATKPLTAPPVVTASISMASAPAATVKAKTTALAADSSVLTAQPAKLTVSAATIASATVQASTPVTVTAPATAKQDSGQLTVEQPVNEPQQQIIAAEEAKMTNQLGQLNHLLNATSASSSPTATAVAEPARAWVAPRNDQDEPAQLLAKQPSVATVIRRRPKASLPHNQARPDGDTIRAPLGRKTLSFKAC